MINKNDLLLLLTELNEKGIECKAQTLQLLKADNIPLDVLKFINDHRTFDAYAFYEKMRRAYNDKKSKLYLNIVKEELESVDILTCLSALQTQILRYSKGVENRAMFLRETRFDDICKVMLNYSKTSDLIPCQKLLSLIKADLKAFEYINNLDNKEKQK